MKAALHDFGDRPFAEIVLVLCCGSGGANRGHVTLFCAYVDTVNDCRVSVGANENVCIGGGAGAGFGLSLVRGGERLMNGVCLEVWGRCGQALIRFSFRFIRWRSGIIDLTCVTPVLCRSLHHNRLTGTIPNGIASLTNLVDLSVIVVVVHVHGPVCGG